MIAHPNVFLAILSGDLNDERKYTLLVDPVPCRANEAPFVSHAPKESKAYSGFFVSAEAALEAAKAFIGGQVSVTTQVHKNFETFDIIKDG